MTHCVKRTKSWQKRCLYLILGRRSCKHVLDMLQFVSKNYNNVKYIKDYKGVSRVEFAMKLCKCAGAGTRFSIKYGMGIFVVRIGVFLLTTRLNSRWLHQLSQPRFVFP